jgi:hypothetical protein
MNNKIVIASFCQISSFFCIGIALFIRNTVTPGTFTDFLQGFLFGLSAVSSITAIILFTTSLASSRTR